MNEAVPLKTLKTQPLNLPKNRDAFYGGKWHKPISGRSADAINPGTGESQGLVADCGNPYSEMLRDATIAAAQIEFYAGLVTEMKGSSIPMGPDVVNFSVREPRGVVGRILPFTHPFMFCAGKSGAPLATGNTVVMKPPEQAPLSSLRLAELIGDILPPGVFNLVPGGREAGSALASHPGVAMIALIGSVPTGRAVMKAASETLKAVMLELGGKNALIAYS